MSDATEEQDLNTIGRDVRSRGAGSDTISPFIESRYDLARDRETKRGTIALALVWTLVGVIAAVVLIGIVTAYGCHAKDSCTTDTSELKTIRIVIEIILTPLVGLVGAVTGFYFGEKSASEKRGA